MHALTCAVSAVGRCAATNYYKCQLHLLHLCLSLKSVEVFLIFFSFFRLLLHLIYFCRNDSGNKLIPKSEYIVRTFVCRRNLSILSYFKNRCYFVESIHSTVKFDSNDTRIQVLSLSKETHFRPINLVALKIKRFV